MLTLISIIAVLVMVGAEWSLALLLLFGFLYFQPFKTTLFLLLLLLLRWLGGRLRRRFSLFSITRKRK